jgi:hypothetical protein
VVYVTFACCVEENIPQVDAKRNDEFYLFQRLRACWELKKQKLSFVLANLFSCQMYLLTIEQLGCSVNRSCSNQQNHGRPQRSHNSKKQDVTAKRRLETTRQKEKNLVTDQLPVLMPQHRISESRPSNFALSVWF